MRTVVRNAFARHTVTAERVRVPRTVDGQPANHAHTCTNCSSQRLSSWRNSTPDASGSARAWLYRFHCDDDQGSRTSGPIANGKLFCSRECAETYIGRSFDESKG